MRYRNATPIVNLFVNHAMVVARDVSHVGVSLWCVCVASMNIVLLRGPSHGQQKKCTQGQKNDNPLLSLGFSLGDWR